MRKSPARLLAPRSVCCRPIPGAAAISGGGSSAPVLRPLRLRVAATKFWRPAARYLDIKTSLPCIVWEGGLAASDASGGWRWWGLRLSRKLRPTRSTAPALSGGPMPRTGVEARRTDVASSAMQRSRQPAYCIANRRATHDALWRRSFLPPKLQRVTARLVPRQVRDLRYRVPRRGP